MSTGDALAHPTAVGIHTHLTATRGVHHLRQWFVWHVPRGRFRIMLRERCILQRLSHRHLWKLLELLTIPDGTRRLHHIGCGVRLWGIRRKGDGRVKPSILRCLAILTSSLGRRHRNGGNIVLSRIWVSRRSLPRLGGRQRGVLSKKPRIPYRGHVGHLRPRRCRCDGCWDRNAGLHA